MPGVNSVNEGSGVQEIDSSSTEIVPAVGNRRVVIISNDSNEVIYLALNATAVGGQGIRLDPVAATGHLPSRIELRDFTGQVNGICASGSKDVAYVDY